MGGAGRARDDDRGDAAGFEEAGLVPDCEPVFGAEGFFAAGFCAEDLGALALVAEAGGWADFFAFVGALELGLSAMLVHLI
jgi:hypothetical protein